jgi:serine/threonine protein kinase
VLISHTDDELSNSQIKLVDFGLSNIIKDKDEFALMEVKVGTAGYQAPEVDEGAQVDTSIDMWAFGVLMHELAVAYKPADKPHFKQYSLNPNR